MNDLEKIAEMENPNTSDELFSISKRIAKVDDNIRKLDRDLLMAENEIESLCHRLRAANESKMKIKAEIEREQEERERLTAALTKARGCSAGEATPSRNLLLIDTFGGTERRETTVSDDDFTATYIGGFWTTDAFVTGVALLEGFIYVLYRSFNEGSRVRVFYDKTMKFQLIKVINLPECLEADSLAANPEARCLYVTDAHDSLNPVILKVTPDNGQVTEWASYYFSLNLSVSLYGHVLILYNRYGHLTYYLDVRLSNAKVLRHYKLPWEELGTPLAVVETSKRSFIICCRVHVLANMTTKCIYKLNEDGQIIRRFAPSGDDPSQHLYNPRYLFLDSWDRVIVADSGSNRVILLDSDLNWNGVLQTRNSFQLGDSPRPFLYHNDTNQIFIAPSRHEVQQIDVYTLTLKPPDDMQSKDDPNYQPPALNCAQINQMPDVVLERILLKVCLANMSSLATEHFHGVYALAAVSRNWYHQLKNKRLHQQIARHLAAQTRVVHCRKLAIRNNEKYLIESIRPVENVIQLPEGATPTQDKGLIDRLYDAKCLTDIQMRLYFRRPSQRARSRVVNNELLLIAQSFNENQHAAFVACLRQTKQQMPADVLERGGVTIDMKVSLTKESKGFTEEIIFTLNRIQDKMVPQKKEFAKLIVQLMDHEIEILGAQKANQQIVVIWLWCYSQESLCRLKELNMQNGHLPSDLFGLTEKLLKSISQTIVLETLHIEEKQLLQDVSVCPIPIKIRTVQKIQGNYFYGVVKFKNKICILSQKPKLIQICSELPPFALVASLPIKQIQNPTDMATGQNCLYIKELRTDNKTSKKKLISTLKEVKCVSKIIFESDDFSEHRVLRWLPEIDENFNLSACRDGRLLLIRDREPSTLEIYGSKTPEDNEASLVQTINLGEYVCRLQHAVETESGNFVISHFLTNSSKCFISEINKSGETVRRFSARDDLQQMTSAFSIALDAYGRVFVADCIGNQVVLLDSQLRWIQVVISVVNGGITEPASLWYDDGMQQMVAARRFTTKACSNPVTMNPAIYVVDIPALSEEF